MLIINKLSKSLQFRDVHFIIAVFLMVKFGICWYRSHYWNNCRLRAAADITGGFYHRRHLLMQVSCWNSYEPIARYSKKILKA